MKKAFKGLAIAVVLALIYGASLFLTNNFFSENPLSIAKILSFFSKAQEPPPQKTNPKPIPKPIEVPKQKSLSTHVQVSSTSIRPKKKRKKRNLKKQFDRHLNKKSKKRLLKVPKKKRQKSKKVAPTLPAPKTERAKGRREREKLPLGVVLWDNVHVFSAETGGERLYSMKTGDFVRVFQNKKGSSRIKIQPGVDLYLAATSKQFEAAGNRFPDKPGWINPTNIQIFNPDQAILFTQGTEPMTLGPNSNFSTVGFYERAMKNPDPVVHRVVGPRIIELLSLHEDYVSTWGSLYRDNDSKIRSVTLSALRRRGVGNNREIVEDLIKRLAELTQGRLRGELEAEGISIINILGKTGLPRVSAAFQSFRDTWAQNQGTNFMSAVDSVIENINEEESLEGE